MSKGTFLSVGQAAESLGLAPRAISYALYDRKLDVTRCPMVSGRRMIPVDYLPEIERILRQNDTPETEPAPETASAMTPEADKVAVA